MMKKLLIQPIKALINYIKYKVYYFKYYHRFIFVHKPLCKNFKKETLLLFNNIYFCRSCFYLYLGLILTLFVTYNFPKAYFINNTIPISLFSLTILLISKPSFYKNFSRGQRDIIRFLNGALASLVLISLCKINILFGTIVLTGLIIVRNLYNRERKKGDLCNNCPELSCTKTCSGYKKQVEALLIFEENYSRTLKIRKELLQ